MKKKFVYIALAALATVMVVYSCSTNSAVKPTPMGPTASVNIQGFAFAPDTVTIKAGGTITWTNQDSAPHTVTELASLFNSGSMATSQTFKYTFNTPGTFTYHCLIHAMMKSGVVIVSN
ncbi:hypothetical protein BH09BAC6_BH09BAC6_04480 [soil metagenome]|jgi:plastocyanin